MHTFPTELWHQLNHEFDLRADYSGRAMFGQRCIALTGHVGDLLRYVATCQRAADELDPDRQELPDALANAVRVDNMGHEHIFYFPGIALDPGT